MIYDHAFALCAIVGRFGADHSAYLKIVCGRRAIRDEQHDLLAC
jgi:ABC-type hemin transport system ATPase subunit